MRQTLLALIAVATFAALGPAAAAPRKAPQAKPAATVPADKPADSTASGPLECRQFVADAGVVIKVPCAASGPSADRTPESGSSARRRDGMDCRRFDAGSGSVITVPCEAATVEHDRREPASAAVEAAETVVAPNAGATEAVAAISSSSSAGLEQPAAVAPQPSAVRPVATRERCGSLIDRVQLGEASAAEISRFKAGC